MRELSIGLPAPWGSFAEAAAAAVRVLRARTGLDAWLVTELVGDQQVIRIADPAALVPPGSSIDWEDGLCSRMTRDEGPRVASVVAAVPVYARLRDGKEPRVGAYLGVPLTRPDGSLYGSLCGYAARPQPPTLARHLPVVELVAGLLATVLALEEAQPGGVTSAPGPRMAEPGRHAGAR